MIIIGIIAFVFVILVIVQYNKNSSLPSLEQSVENNLKIVVETYRSNHTAYTLEYIDQVLKVMEKVILESFREKEPVSEEMRNLRDELQALR